MTMQTLTVKGSYNQNLVVICSLYCGLGENNMKDG